MNSRDIIFVKHILDAIKDIETSTNLMSKEKFLKSNDVKDACIRRLEIIGEASKKIPKSVRNVNKHINWEALSRYRDFIVHSYFEASLNRIWKRAKEELPKLKDDFKNIKLL